MEAPQPLPAALRNALAPVYMQRHSAPPSTEEQLVTLANELALEAISSTASSAKAAKATKEAEREARVLERGVPAHTDGGGTEVAVAVCVRRCCR